MGISSEKLLALGQLFNQAGTMYAAPGSSQAAFNERMSDTFSTQQQAVALRKQKEAEEKKRKSSLFGSIGSTLGTIAGVALAPVTGGASLAIPALAGAAGGAIGGTVGNLVGGGGFNPQQSLMYGAQGAMGGLAAGMFAPAAAGAAGAGVTDAATIAGNSAMSAVPTAGTAGTVVARGATGARLLIDPAAKAAANMGGITSAAKALGSAAFAPQSFAPAAIAGAAPAAATGFGSKLFNNPNVQGYFASQMGFVPNSSLLGSMFQPVQGGLYMNKNNMSNDLLFRNPRYYNGVEY